MPGGGLRSSGGCGSGRELLDQWRLGELKLGEDGALRGRDLAALAEAAGGATEAPELQLLKLAAQGGPALLAGRLHDAHEQQGEPAEHDVGADAIFPAVVDGAQVEDLLHVPPAALDLGELLVAEGDVLR